MFLNRDKIMFGWVVEAKEYKHQLDPINGTIGDEEVHRISYCFKNKKKAQKFYDKFVEIAPKVIELFNQNKWEKAQKILDKYGMGNLEHNLNNPVDNLKIRQCTLIIK